MNRKKVIREILEVSDLLERAINSFNKSYQIASKIDVSQELNDENQIYLESYTSRFSRLSDIYTQKFLKAFFLLLGLTDYSLIDKANWLEKHNIIDEFSVLIDIRDLRNDITHEYIIEELNLNFESALKKHNNLIIMIQKSISYAKENLTKY